MTAKHFKQPKHARHMLAGQAAGALRPSSGYGFKRILHWANHAAIHFHKTHTIPRPKYHMGLQHQLDRIFFKYAYQRSTICTTAFYALSQDTKW